MTNGIDRFATMLDGLVEFGGVLRMLVDVARQAIPGLSGEDIRVLAERHVPPRLRQQYEDDVWRPRFLMSARTVGLHDAFLPNNWLLVALVAHLEAFLGQLFADTATRLGRQDVIATLTNPRDADWRPSYSNLKTASNSLQVDLTPSGSTWKDLDELSDKRNCIVHRAARIDCKYRGFLRDAPRRTDIPRGDLPLGQDLFVSTDELHYHILQVKAVAQETWRQCSSPVG